MATPPTFVADYEGDSWDTTLPKTTGTFDGALGDVLASLLVNSNDAGTENYTWTSSPSETWTENAETTGTTANDVFLQSATAILSAAHTGMTVTATDTAGAAVKYNHVVAHFTGSDGVGNTARLTGNGVAAPSFAFTTNFDNSAIVYAIGDWNATDGTTRTHRTVNGFTPDIGNGQELVYYRNAVDYTVYGAYIVDAGAAGSKTIGISEPAGGDCLIAAVEIRGVASTAPIVDISPDSWCVVNGTFGRVAIEDDGGDPITAREWKVISGPVDAGEIVGRDVVNTWAPTATGSYVIRYTATNGIGASFDEINLEVGAAIEGPQNSSLMRR